MELYHNSMSVCAQKVRLVLAEKNLAPTEHAMNLRKGDTHTAKYLQLNPNGVVPTLVDRDHPIIESTVICEYLEEAYPEPPLAPCDPIERARMRLWTLLPDASLHRACGLLSVGVAWRHQIIAAGGAQTRTMGNDLSLKPLLDVVEKGLDSPHVATAIQIHDGVLGRMNRALDDAEWLAGDSYSLADASLMPYLLRLEHLEMQWMWQDSAGENIGAWLQRSKARPNYRGISDYLDEQDVALAQEKGSAESERLKSMFHEHRA